MIRPPFEPGWLAGLVLATLLSTPQFALAALNASGSTATAGDYESAPPQVVQGSDPFLLINLSVELTQQAEAFTDGPQTYAGGTVCGGRVSFQNETTGVCFTSREKYIGYFDAEKCYKYSTGGTALAQRAEGPYSSGSPPHFYVSRMAVNRECGASGEFAGNFLNWATMTALDEFRSVMTGGARLVDTAGANAKTLLVRTHRYNDWAFVRKAISSNTGKAATRITGFATNVSKVTPWNRPAVVISNSWTGVGPKVRFSTYDSDGKFDKTYEYDVVAKVCDPSVGLENNCVRYSDGSNVWYKPEGLIQKNALKMRYALTSYTGKAGNDINGGVLRANAKYIGSLRPKDDGGLEVNPNAEITDSGVQRFNPDNVTVGNGVVNSGIINYINHFGLAAGRYKSNDPAAELYYEGLRYLMGLGPTPSFSAGLNNAEKDGYPIYNQPIGSGSAMAWTDPITNQCQKNYAMYVGDQFAHSDNYLPGKSCGAECSDALAKGVNADTLTDLVGTKEGFHAGTLGGQTRGRSDGYWIAGLAYWANINDIRDDIDGVQRVKTFIVDTQEYQNSPPARQSNQLWLAGKYGGFEDFNGDQDPNNSVSSNKNVGNPEWTTQTGSNPDPNAYTLASQPANMVSGLTQAFSEVLEKSSSASAAAVVANASRGTGAVYQAIYEPRLSDGNTVVTWSGLLRGLFIDDDARIREDSDGDAQLTSADLVVSFVKDDDLKISYAQLHHPTTGALVSNEVAIRDVKSIWDARQQLASLTDAEVVTQRPYTASTASGRHIFTWVDLNLNGVVDSGEEQPFTAANFAQFDTSGATWDQARLLGLNSGSAADESAVEELAGQIVDYIRGKDQAGWRNRAIDLGNGRGIQTLRLGDIVHSAPLVVGAPSDNYDLIYRDNTYADFKERYRNRRQVVYAGANDGMLHAFNAGFFNSATNRFVTQHTTEVAHPLGSELWAYVPFNLLPHLRWLTDSEYPHVYYVDGAPRTFDVNMFTPDADHPHGWGTILVVGFRLGGGDLTVNPAQDGSHADDITFRSGYVVLDVTNPEKPPKLIAEISHPELGFTTSAPTVVKSRATTSGSFASPSRNKWYLLFGSGPAGTDGSTKQVALEGAVSNQQARVFAYDLVGRALVDFDASPGVQAALIPGENNAFVGALVGMDWDNDYTDEAIYLGTVAGSVADPEGSLLRLEMPSTYTLGTPGFAKVINLGATRQPFSAPPMLAKDVRGQPWVYAATGRFFTQADVLSHKRMSFFAVKEDQDGSSVDLDATFPKSSLIDVTGLRVFQSGVVQGNSGGAVSLGGNTVNTFPGLVRAIEGGRGWYFDFEGASARFVDRIELARDNLVFVDYVASNDSCDPQGSSRLYALNMRTGTASPYAPLGTSSQINGLVMGNVDLGFGQYFLSGLHQNKNGQMTVLTTGSSADLNPTLLSGGSSQGRRMSWRELPLE